MIESSEKLVRLPNKVWEELQKAGYRIPAKSFDPELYVRAKVQFTRLVKVLPTKAKKYLMFLILQTLAPINADIARQIAKVYGEGDRGHELFNFYADKIEDSSHHSKTEKEVPSKEPSSSYIEEEVG